jgi:hypothetical protein
LFREYPVNGPPRQLERLPALFARYLSGRVVAGNLREREDLVRSIKSPDPPPHKYVKVDADTGEEMANEDIVKGYKVDTETLIEVTNEEFEDVALESTRTIEIDEFVDRTEIDPPLSDPPLLPAIGR